MVTNMMGDSDRAELYVLHQEYEWVMTEELPTAYSQLKHVLQDCLNLYPPTDGSHAPKTDKYVMSAAPHTTHDHVKAIVTVMGDTITQADINVKVGGTDSKRGVSTANVAGVGSSSTGSAGPSNHNLQRTSVTPDAPWRLQQIQDSCNYLKQALLVLNNSQSSPKTSGGSQAELGKISALIQNSRQCLLVPRRKTIEELLASMNMKALSPPLSQDTAISFYVQGHKLVLAVYQIGCATSGSSNVKFESVHAECPLPWLSRALAALTTGLHLTYSINDKISVFSQYKDFSPDTCSVSTVSC